MSSQLNNDQLNLLGTLLALLGDVLQTIAVIRSIQENNDSGSQSATQETTADLSGEAALQDAESADSGQSTAPTETQGEASPPIV
ncbi:MAG TPA: hypothetical protein GX499_09545 [Clostridiales bacterium]|nr:hypothetical protein [Clostridiales bacterium]